LARGKRRAERQRAGACRGARFCRAGGQKWGRGRPEHGARQARLWSAHARNNAGPVLARAEVEARGRARSAKRKPVVALRMAPWRGANATYAIGRHVQRGNRFARRLDRRASGARSARPLAGPRPHFCPPARQNRKRAPARPRPLPLRTPLAARQPPLRFALLLRRVVPLLKRKRLYADHDNETRRRPGEQPYIRESTGDARPGRRRETAGPRGRRDRANGHRWRRLDQPDTPPGARPCAALEPLGHAPAAARPTMRDTYPRRVAAGCAVLDTPDTAPDRSGTRHAEHGPRRRSGAGPASRPAPAAAAQAGVRPGGRGWLERRTVFRAPRGPGFKGVVRFCSW
jgi:hypothetical protein